MTHSDSNLHHNHSHAHAPSPDTPDVLSYYQVMEIAVRELLIEKGIISSDEIRRAIEFIDARTPALGARAVAKAWVDDQFKKRLLANANSAFMELGIDIGATNLVVVENSSSVHNMIVCTLCSCYPRMVLGLPPDWYKSHEYRSRAVREPRAVLAEFGAKVGPDIGVRVHDSTANMRYLVLPERPAGTENMSETELAALVTRDAMIGVALVTANG